jgi:hypothetical protein
MNFKYLSVTLVTPIFTDISATGTLERLDVFACDIYKVCKSHDPALYFHFF